MTGYSASAASRLETAHRVLSEREELAVTILVAGDVNFISAGGCCANVDVRGQNGSTGTTNAAGTGGLGGFGAFRGGDGASRLIFGLAIGAAGFGGGGGQGGDQATGCGGRGGQFFGALDLIPLVGGAGGGGGCSVSDRAAPVEAAAVGAAASLSRQMARSQSITISCWRMVLVAGIQTTAVARQAAGAVRAVPSGYSPVSSCRSARRTFRREAEAVPIRQRPGPLDEFASRRWTIPSSPSFLPIRPHSASRANASRGSCGTDRHYHECRRQSMPAIPQGVFGTIDVVVPVSGVTAVDLTTTGIPGGTTDR